MSATSSYFRTQKGNVLFMILLAVALFAALSYAVTNSTRSAGGDISKEQLELHVGNILQYSNSVENAIMRMRLRNNCDDSQISFENTTVSGYSNSNAPADKRCHVFDDNGGGAVFVKNNPDYIDASYAGNGATLTVSPVYINVWAVGKDSGATNIGLPTFCSSPPYCSDFLMVIPAIKKEMCLAINRKLGISTVSSDAPPQRWGCGLTGKEWNGTNPTGCKWTFNTNEVKPFETGCTKGVGSMAGGYFFFHAILPR